MKTKIIEATDGFNWGRFLVAQFQEEWAATSQVDGGHPILIPRWDRHSIFVMDVVTGEGAIFGPWGLASADLNKHRIWVCPLFEPWLEWLYRQNPIDIDKLPTLVNLDPADTAKHNDLAGYRRPGIRLTRREFEVLDLWLLHLNDKKVANILGTAEQTVTNQITSIEEKFGVKSRLELQRACLATGLKDLLDASTDSDVKERAAVSR